MRDELDDSLCKDFPKIFKDRHANPSQTCMCWGFACSDGWEPLLRAACAAIQSHIDGARKNRVFDLRWNRMLQKGIDGDLRATLEGYFYKDGGKVQTWTEKRIDEIITDPTVHFRKVTPTVAQFVASQVKEKYGGLRFYYDGGDDYCRGIVDFAEYMSEKTCEQCGNRGEIRGGGWVYNACDLCEEKRIAEQDAKAKARENG